MDGVAIIYAFDLQKNTIFLFRFLIVVLRTAVKELYTRIHNQYSSNFLCALTQLKRFSILSHLVFATAHYYWLWLSEMSVDLFNYPVENFQCNVALLI